MPLELPIQLSVPWSAKTEVPGVDGYPLVVASFRVDRLINYRSMFQPKRQQFGQCLEDVFASIGQ